MSLRNATDLELVTYYRRELDEANHPKGYGNDERWLCAVLREKGYPRLAEAILKAKGLEPKTHEDKVLYFQEYR